MYISARSVEEWGRALKFPLFVGVGLFVAWRLFRKKKDFSFNNIDPNGLAVTLAGYSHGGAAPYSVAFSDDAIKSDANSLLTAFDDGWAGTDTEAVKEIRQKYVGRPRDLARLWNAFGMPKYGVVGKAVFGGTPTNLRGWIKAELSGYEADAWSDMLKQIGK